MSLITTLTRMWLTRSVRPFTFKNEYDQELPYAGCENLGLYIHIPFCRTICSFCPYCKVRYDEELCSRYIDALLAEISMVGSQYQAQHGTRKTVTSLYFGGGSPALAADRIGEILDTVGEYFAVQEGIGLELHPEDVTVPTLQWLKNAGITKISIGIQSFQEKYQDILGRKPVDGAAMAAVLAEVPFETVSMDFIFALPGQTFRDLQADIDTAFAIGANHIAIYPFIDFDFTASTVPAMSKKEKRKLLNQVTAYCRKKGYRRDSIWTFASFHRAKYSSMTRDNFLGFGCSATTLLPDQFKINTFSVEEYCRRIGVHGEADGPDRVSGGKLPTSLTIRFTPRQRMVYFLFWTAYSTRVDSRDFEKFFGVPLKKMYGFELWLAKLLGFAAEQDGIYTMTDKGAFYYHYYEQFYTLSYIDKMWGILREEAFPEGIEL